MANWPILIIEGDTLYPSTIRGRVDNKQNKNKLNTCDFHKNAILIYSQRHTKRLTTHIFCHFACTSKNSMSFSSCKCLIIKDVSANRDLFSSLCQTNCENDESEQTHSNATHSNVAFGLLYE